MHLIIWWPQCEGVLITFLLVVHIKKSYFFSLHATVWSSWLLNHCSPLPTPPSLYCSPPAPAHSHCRPPCNLDFLNAEKSHGGKWMCTLIRLDQSRFGSTCSLLFMVNTITLFSPQHELTTPSMKFSNPDELTAVDNQSRSLMTTINFNIVWKRSNFIFELLGTLERSMF